MSNQHRPKPLNLTRYDIGVPAWRPPDALWVIEQEGRLGRLILGVDVYRLKPPDTSMLIAEWDSSQIGKVELCFGNAAAIHARHARGFLTETIARHSGLADIVVTLITRDTGT